MGQKRAQECSGALFMKKGKERKEREEWKNIKKGEARKSMELFLQYAISSFLLLEQRIHLDIRIGEHDLDTAIAQAKDKVNEVTFKLEHLIEQIEQILKEQNYQRVSLPTQLILSLPAKNTFLNTKLQDQGINCLFLDLLGARTEWIWRWEGGRNLSPLSSGPVAPLGKRTTAHSALYPLC